MIICSRPCEKTSWLAKYCPFDRHLEVVGFTEEKIGQFVESYFGPGHCKTHELQERLVSQPDVRSLMHTPLLATMICRQFEFNQALPSTQTEVYQEAVTAMLQQSATRDGDVASSSALDDLSSPRLKKAVTSLSHLAYEALSLKSGVFLESKLKKAGCLDDDVLLGFLSASPGVNVTGQRQDVFSFPHHTMQEFFCSGACSPHAHCFWEEDRRRSRL